MAVKPKSRRLSSRWSKVRELAFLEHLAFSSNVAASERVAKLTPGTAYRQRRKVTTFARAWDVALREGYGRLEEAMLTHAINGVEVTVVRKDGSTETKRVYPEATQKLLYTSHRATVLGPASIDPECARERLARKIAEIDRRLGPETAE